MNASSFTFPVINLEAMPVDGVASVGGFYEWDSEKMQVVDLGLDYHNALAVRLMDTETGSSVYILRPEVTMKKLADACAQIEAAYKERELAAELLAEVTESKPAAVFTEADMTQAIEQGDEQLPNGNDAMRAVCAEPVLENFLEQSDEPEGTLLTSEVMVELIQTIGKMRKRIEELEKQNEPEQFMDRVNGVIAAYDWNQDTSLSNEVQRVLEDDADIKEKVEQIIEEYNFESIVESVVNDMDFDEDIKTVINDMDFENKVLESLDGCNIQMVISGTDADGKLMVAVSCN